jgi:hypothetical protein
VKDQPSKFDSALDFILLLEWETQRHSMFWSIPRSNDYKQLRHHQNSHFIAHLMRSNARDSANPDSGPATTSQAIPGSTTLFTADQMDDLLWFFRGFYTKRVAGVQKLSEVVICYTLSSLYGVLKRKKWRRSNLKKVSSTREGFG